MLGPGAGWPFWVVDALKGSDCHSWPVGYWCWRATIQRYQCTAPDIMVIMRSHSVSPCRWADWPMASGAVASLHPASSLGITASIRPPPPTVLKGPQPARGLLATCAHVPIPNPQKPKNQESPKPNHLAIASGLIRRRGGMVYWLGVRWQK